MFKDLFRNRLFIGALAIFIFCVGGSLLYMQHVTQKGEKELAETQERVAQWNEKQKPITEVSQTETAQGHVHADGTFHAEPHDAPVVEVSEAEVSADVQDAFVGGQQSDIQIAAPEEELSVPSQDDGDVNRAWVEWSKKARELRNEYSQANRALINALPSTEEEQKRHDTDEQFRREMGLKVTEAGKEIGDVRRRMREHDKKNPLLQ